MKKQFYFSYGNNGNQDFKGGHTIIWAESEYEARKEYARYFGTTNGIAMFAFSYNKEVWDITDAASHWGFNIKLNMEIGNPEFNRNGDNLIKAVMVHNGYLFCQVVESVGDGQYNQDEILIFIASEYKDTGLVPSCGYEEITMETIKLAKDWCEDEYASLGGLLTPDEVDND